MLKEGRQTGLEMSRRVSYDFRKYISELRKDGYQIDDYWSGRHKVYYLVEDKPYQYPIKKEIIFGSKKVEVDDWDKVGKKLHKPSDKPIGSAPPALWAD